MLCLVHQAAKLWATVCSDAHWYPVFYEPVIQDVHNEFRVSFFWHGCSHRPSRIPVHADQIVLPFWGAYVNAELFKGSGCLSFDLWF